MLEKVKVSNGKKIEFRKDCISYLVAVVSKLKERSPLKYRIVCALSSLSPQIIYSSPNLGRKRFEELLTCLHEQKWVNASKADTATLQYDELCRIAKTLYEKEFKEFDMYKSRLDDFMVSILSDKEDLAVLYEVIQMVLILSHGNAQVESGFSINGDILSENLQEESVVAQRQVYDGIHYQGRVLNVLLEYLIPDIQKH